MWLIEGWWSEDIMREVEETGGRKWNIENSSMDVYFDNCLSSEQNQYCWKIRGKGMLRRKLKWMRDKKMERGENVDQGEPRGRWDEQKERKIGGHQRYDQGFVVAGGRKRGKGGQYVFFPARFMFPSWLGNLVYLMGPSIDCSLLDGNWGKEAISMFARSLKK